MGFIDEWNAKEKARLDGTWLYDSEDYRIKKLFQPRHGWNNFWPPVLDQLERIEYLYQKSTMRGDSPAKFQRRAKILKNIVGPGHNRIEYLANYSDENGKPGWYTIRRLRGYANYSWTKSFGTNPATNVNKHTLGTELTQNESGYSEWHFKLQKLLEDAIIHKLEKEYNPEKLGWADHGRLFELNINGRRYLYAYDYAYSPDRLHFRKVFWPKDFVRFSCKTLNFWYEKNRDFYE